MVHKIPRKFPGDEKLLIFLFFFCRWNTVFAFNDLLTNLERIAAHCSNVAVAMIETETSEFDTHEYLKSVRHMKDDAYLECFDSYARKYSIPPTKKEKKNK